MVFGYGADCFVSVPLTFYRLGYGAEGGAVEG